MERAESGVANFNSYAIRKLFRDWSSKELSLESPEHVHLDSALALGLSTYSKYLQEEIAQTLEIIDGCSICEQTASFWRL